MSPDTDAQREELLDAILPHIPFDGFSEKSFLQACRDLGLSEPSAHHLCPHGAADLAYTFLARGDKRLEEKLREIDLTALRMRERIIQGVRLRLELDAEHREILARAVAVFSRPTHVSMGLRALHHTVDVIWRAAGDEASDFNYYSKRAILAGIFSATLMRWLADKPNDHATTWAFLGRRVEDVMRFEKTKAKMRTTFSHAPNILGALSRLRFRRSVNPAADKDA